MGFANSIIKKACGEARNTEINEVCKNMVSGVELLQHRDVTCTASIFQYALTYL